MLSKTFLIIISSLLLFSVGQLHLDIGYSPLPIPTPPPPPGDQPPQPPDGEPNVPPNNEAPSDDENLLQTLWDNLEAAWDEVENWLDGAVQDLQRSIQEALDQFLQGLIDQLIQEVTRTLQELLNQTCGAALLFPAALFAGLWLISRRHM